MLATVYGKDSKIYQLKADVNRIRLTRHGIVTPKERVKLPDTRSAKQIHGDRYWHNAQALLIHVSSPAVICFTFHIDFRISDQSLGGIECRDGKILQNRS
jgi:hypothetical protein